MTQQNYFSRGPDPQNQGGIQPFGRRQPAPALMAPDPQNYSGGTPQSEGTYAAPAYSSPGQSNQVPGMPQYPPGYVPRKFFYKGQEYFDPGPEFSIQDVLNALADKAVPELRGGTWSTETRPEDGGLNVTFKKVSGEKGMSITAAGIENWKLIRLGTFGLILICQVMLGVIGTILMTMSNKPQTK